MHLASLSDAHLHTRACTKTHPHSSPTARNPSCAAGSQWRPGLCIPFRLVLGCISYAHTHTLVHAKNTPNKHKPTWAGMYTNTYCLLMREGGSAVKATAEWNLLTKDWPVVQGRQQLSGELLSQRWSEGCTAEAAHADGAGKTNWLNATVASAQLLYGKKASSLLYIFSLIVCLSVSFVFLVLCWDSGAGGLELRAWGICA